MEAGTKVRFIYTTPHTEVSSSGRVVSYIEPDREDGERTGAYIVLDFDGNTEREVDERDVWPA